MVKKEKLMEMPVFTFFSSNLDNRIEKMILLF